MQEGWRAYCLKCDELGEWFAAGDPIPSPTMHQCGRMLVLVSGLFVKNREEHRVGELLRRNAYGGADR